MNKTTVTVSDGYKIFEEKTLYDFDSVCKVLNEDDLKIISSAVIKEDKVEVEKNTGFVLCVVVNIMSKETVQFLPTALKIKFCVLICFILLMF